MVLAVFASTLIIYVITVMSICMFKLLFSCLTVTLVAINVDKTYSLKSANMLKMRYSRKKIKKTYRSFFMKEQTIRNLIRAIKASFNIEMTTLYL